jgi:hypothetical protein
MIPVGPVFVARLAAVIAGIALSTAAFAADPKEKADYERRLDSVKTLRQALQRDPAAESVNVKAALAKVEARQKEAAELAGVGEYGLAKSILDEGYQTLTATIAQTKGGTGYQAPAGGDDGKLRQDKQKADFERELASANALLDAAKRSDAEKGNAHGGDVTNIEALIKQASGAAGKNDFAAADKLIVEALNKEKQLIASLKGGSGPKASPAPAAAEGQDRDIKALDEHLLSSRTMLDALKRQNGEKKAGKDAVIKAAEQQLGRAESLRGSDPKQALRLANEADASIRGALQSIQKPSTQKAGSAALEANEKSGSAGNANAEKKKTDLASMLRSAQTLRDSLARQSSERGVDSGATLKQIDQLSSEAKRHETSDVDRALKSADEAYQTAKVAIEKLRGGN